MGSQDSWAPCLTNVVSFILPEGKREGWRPRHPAVGKKFDQWHVPCQLSKQKTTSTYLKFHLNPTECKRLKKKKETTSYDIDKSKTGMGTGSGISMRFQMAVTRRYDGQVLGMRLPGLRTSSPPLPKRIQHPQQEFPFVVSG